MITSKRNNGDNAHLEIQLPSSTDCRRLCRRWRKAGEYEDGSRVGCRDWGPPSTPGQGQGASWRPGQGCTGDSFWWRGQWPFPSWRSLSLLSHIWGGLFAVSQDKDGSSTVGVGGPKHRIREGKYKMSPRSPVSGLFPLCYAHFADQKNGTQKS